MNPAIAKHEYGVEVVTELPTAKYDTAILAVAHNQFKELNLATLLNNKSVVYDVKWNLDGNITDGRL